MAHKTIGVDLGHSSMKLVRFDAGFRKVRLLDAQVVPNPAGAESASASATAGPAAAAPAQPSPVERVTAQIQALKRALSEDWLAADELALALPGDLVTFRLVDLPFSDERRIESVLGYELESQVMGAIEEMVIDHVVVGRRGDGDTRVLVAMAPKAVIEAVVVQAAAEQLPIRILGAAPLAGVALAHAAAAPREGEAPPPPGTTMIIDVGHEYSTVCMVQGGAPEMARTIPRAGRHFTDGIAQSFRLDFARAESAKLDAGFIGHRAMLPETPSQERMDRCLRDAARPLVRELRQTLAAYRASYGTGVERLWVTGGGSRLIGLREHLGDELGLRVETLPWPELERPPGGGGEFAAPPDLMAVAMGTALAAVGDAPSVNFRKGEFAYRSDFSFLRQKALHLGVAGLAILCFAVLNAVVSLSGLNEEHKQLTTRLERATMEIFGEPRLDAHAVSEEIKSGAKVTAGPPVPTMTAFDLLDEISRRMPPPEKARVDVLELDIKPKKTFLKATAETAQQVDDIADALSKIECFDEVKKGKLSRVSAPAREAPAGEGESKDKDKPARSELYQFTLDIVSSCP